jgi:hypothetical protein
VGPASVKSQYTLQESPSPFAESCLQPQIASWPAIYSSVHSCTAQFPATMPPFQFSAHSPTISDRPSTLVQIPIIKPCNQASDATPGIIPSPASVSLDQVTKAIPTSGSAHGSAPVYPVFACPVSIYPVSRVQSSLGSISINPSSDPLQARPGICCPAPSPVPDPVPDSSLERSSRHRYQSCLSPGLFTPRRFDHKLSLRFG